MQRTSRLEFARDALRFLLRIEEGEATNKKRGRASEEGGPIVGVVTSLLIHILKHDWSEIINVRIIMLPRNDQSDLLQAVFLPF